MHFYVNTKHEQQDSIQVCLCVGGKYEPNCNVKKMTKSYGNAWLERLQDARLRKKSPNNDEK